MPCPSAQMCSPLAMLRTTQQIELTEGLLTFSAWQINMILDDGSQHRLWQVRLPQELHEWRCSKGLSYRTHWKLRVAKTEGRNIAHVHCREIRLTSFVLKNWSHPSIKETVCLPGNKADHLYHSHIKSDTDTDTKDWHFYWAVF